MCTDLEKAIHFLEAGGWDENVAGTLFLGESMGPGSFPKFNNKSPPPPAPSSNNNNRGQVNPGSRNVPKPVTGKDLQDYNSD